MSAALYRLQGLEYSYLWNKQQVPVLRGIDLELEKGLLYLHCRSQWHGEDDPFKFIRID